MRDIFSRTTGQRSALEAQSNKKLGSPLMLRIQYNTEDQVQFGAPEVQQRNHYAVTRKATAI
jgi:hypothetical protein